jgi:hypothetical protein
VSLRAISRRTAEPRPTSKTVEKPVRYTTKKSGKANGNPLHLIVVGNGVDATSRA